MKDGVAISEVHRMTMQNMNAQFEKFPTNINIFFTVY